MHRPALSVRCCRQSPGELRVVGQEPVQPLSERPESPLSLLRSLISGPGQGPVRFATLGPLIGVCWGLHRAKVQCLRTEDQCESG